ncbi:SMI1/KNR4 family protein [Coraliomargarita sp. W4R72]
MNTLETITQYLKSPHPDEDGEDRGTKKLPGLSENEIETFERECGSNFTTDIKELLRNCGGLEEGPMEIIDFKGEMVDYLRFGENRIKEISPDGFGNFWFYWLPHVSEELGPIFYYQHEGPMLFYQSHSLREFISECIRFMTPPYDSLIDDVHEFRIKRIQDLNSDLIPITSYEVDPKTESFISSLQNDVLIYDFRNSKVGDGVDLQKLEVVEMHPDLPILAIRKRKSLFQKLFKKN